MAGKGGKFQRNKLVAKLVTENGQPCVFCQQNVDDEVIYGKLYSLGDIQCHYFCVLLSCCLVQKGRDSEGLFGFLYKDIMAEVERSKKHKCSYCGRGGASLGCSVSQCRKQFHLPCGRSKNVVSLFYGNYKSFCELHAPKQKISGDVMANAKARLKRDRTLKTAKKPTVVEDTEQTSGQEREEPVCVICYEEVQGYPTSQTFWPPCCGRDAWLHRSCLQRMALSAGMHYLKCPLCNDKEQFYEAVCEQGYYLPDRDAAWELEQNAFAEMYERPAACGAVECRCPFGRSHDEPGVWDVKLCLLCGSCGLHAACAGAGGARAVCAACRPAAPPDLAALEHRLDQLVREEQAREARSTRLGPLMPSRMSLRRTKGRLPTRSGTSSQFASTIPPTSDIKTEVQEPKLETSRQELNLKTPKKPSKFLEPGILKDLENKLLSPIKMLEQSCLEKFGGLDDMMLDSNEVIEKMRAKFNKPRPLCEKKRIVNEILEDLLGKVFMEKPKSKDPLKEWNTPKKRFDVTELTYEDSKENVNIMKTISVEAITVTENLDQDVVNDINTDAFAELNSNEENKSNENDKRSKDENDNRSKDENDNRSKDKNDNRSKDENDNRSKDENDNRSKDENDVEMTRNDTAADENLVNDDESTTSTFQLPAEFVAESDDSLPIFDTPKKLKTVEIEHNSSLEISEHDEMVNVDVVQRASGKENDCINNRTLSPVKNENCSFKFSPKDKESLQSSNIDVETFKDQYLSEVERKFKCTFNHNHTNTLDKSKLRSVIDFALDAADRKRKLEFNVGGGKRRKKDKSKKVSVLNENIQDNRERRLKKLKKKARDLKLKKMNIRLKIKWKDEKVKDKVRKKKQKVKTYKQYVLKYSPMQTHKVIEKPEIEVTPMKRKYNIKLEKSPDNLIQTSIQNFFKVK